MSETLEFTVKETFDRKALLAEALEIVSYADIDMGPKPEADRVEAGKKKAIELLKKLEEEQALFSPKLDVRRITIQDFEERGIEPSLDLKAKMDENDFYHVNIPVTLFPKTGWAFTRLECWVGFCEDEPDKSLCPTIYEIFPEDVWETVLSFQNQLNLGLDESLQFRTEIEKLEGKWQKLSAEAKAKVAVQVEGKMNLVAGPFSYNISRSKVRGRGRSNVESFWRLDSNKHVDQEDVLLGVVLMVPKRRKLPVNATGILKAYHDFQVLDAPFSDWKRDFRDAIKTLFNAGMVVEATGEWQDITG